MEKTYHTVMTDYLRIISEASSSKEKLDYLDYMINSTKFFRGKINQRIRKNNIKQEETAKFSINTIQEGLDLIDMVEDTEKPVLLEGILSLIESSRKDFLKTIN